MRTLSAKYHIRRGLGGYDYEELSAEVVQDPTDEKQLKGEELMMEARRVCCACLTETLKKKKESKSNE